MRTAHYLVTGLICFCLFACSEGPHQTGSISVTSQEWGVVNGKTAYLYTLKNSSGVTVKVSNWGGYIQSILVPDRDGKFEDILVGYDDWNSYANDCCYAGPIVGRFGNRIAFGRFSIDGEDYQLTTNNGGKNNDLHQLHGGLKGLHKRLWESKMLDNGVQLTYLSKDGEEGYPGNLSISVDITLSDDNALKFEYTATTDKTTPVNLTSHTYFNLSGDMKRDIEDHVLMIAADKTTRVDQYLIPTGELDDVEGTPFDFRQAKAIAEDIRTNDVQLRYAGGMDTQFGGYDHNWVFSRQSETPIKQASLHDPVSGRLMEILTDQPAIQFYSGNFMDGTMIGKHQMPVEFRYGLALEPQHYPDSPNHAHFPSTLLAPGETYYTVSIYRFSTQ